MFLSILAPDLADWDDLTNEEKRIDRYFVRVIPQRIADAGFEIYRYDEKEKLSDISSCYE